jgi:hypothetical protein
MLTEQSKFCFGMVKRPVEPSRQCLAPAGCRMARLACLRKSTSVRIRMAITTSAECDAGVAWSLVAPWRVATLTGNVGMRASQGITR